MAEKKKFINRDMIKYLAIIPMAVGHFFAYYYDSDTAGMSLIPFIFTNLSVFAPPVFFFFIAEGYHYTRSQKKYALRLLIFALINQIPFCLANYSTLLTTEIFKCWNIIFTLFLGLCCLMIWDSGMKLPLRITIVALIDILTVLIMSEWMLFGIPLILGFHIFRDKPKARLIWFTSLITAHIFIEGFFNFSGWAISLSGAALRAGAMLLAFYLVTSCYNGKKGSHPTFAKWFFYIFYPAHLFAIYIMQIMK